VRHALTKPHSRTFDYLALFALHLARMGRRNGIAGDPKGAGFANEFVCSQLWVTGGWVSANLTDAKVEAAFNSSIIATGSDTVHKCMTNYMFMLGLCGLRQQRTRFINTHIDEWVGPAFFLAFDRVWLDDFGGMTPSDTQLIAAVKTDEIHKLMGASEDYIDAVAPIFAAEYTKLGGLNRPMSWPIGAVGSVAARPVPSVSTGSIASIARRVQEVQSQLRNSRHVRELKHLHNNTCCFCGKQTIVGVEPDKYYSEAAHIQPVGVPHGGPDTKANMIILCPEHHLQFDRGVLSLRQDGASLRIVSKITGDVLNGKTGSPARPSLIRR
jgi:hypothetical protein